MIRSAQFNVNYYMFILVTYWL